LLEAGANPNTTDPGGYAPLDTVVIARWPELLELLLDYGTRLDLSKDEGRFATERAIAKGDGATLQLLVDFGLQPSMKLANGMAAIDFAKKCKREDLVRILHREGAHRSPKLAKTAFLRPKKKIAPKKIPMMAPDLIGFYEIDFEETAKSMIESGKGMAAGRGMEMKKGYDRAVEKFVREQRKALRGVGLKIGDGTFTFRSTEGEERSSVRLKKKGKERTLLVERDNRTEEFLVREVVPGSFQFQCETSDLSRFVWKKR
jgi:hypothetical protein